MNKKFSVLIKKKIKKFKKNIYVESDKSISHRALLISSQCIGSSKIENILESEDVMNTVNCLKKLGVKIKKKTMNVLFTEMVWVHLKNLIKMNFTLEILEH